MDVSNKKDGQVFLRLFVVVASSYNWCVASRSLSCELSTEIHRELSIQNDPYI